MNNKTLFLAFFLAASFLACRQRNVIEIRPIFSDKKSHIGDSIIVNNLLSTIIFSDTSLIIDSIVYSRFPNSSKSIKAINTYVKGKKAFENIEYNETGKLNSYKFLNPDCENCFYKREYDNLGNLISSSGNYLFECNVDKINLETLSIKKGTTITLRLFYANPPDCETFTYVRFAANQKLNVFYQHKQIRFLKTVAVDNDNEEKENWTQIEVGVEVKDDKLNKIDTISKSLFYKVTE